MTSSPSSPRDSSSSSHHLFHPTHFTPLTHPSVLLTFLLTFLLTTLAFTSATFTLLTFFPATVGSCGPNTCGASGYILFLTLPILCISLILGALALILFINRILHTEKQRHPGIPVKGTVTTLLLLLFLSTVLATLLIISSYINNVS